MKDFFTFSRFTLFVALLISLIAAWYSVQGLTTIFAGALVPIIIMGSVLELAKITTTVWLHKHWLRASTPIKIYLTSAVVALAFLTSMGIFGLLSKAHSNQNMISGDVQAQVSLLDEKIKTQRDNIDLSRKALEQMDTQVDQRLARGTSENSAERAVQIRRQQAPERTRLQKDISEAQKEIGKLNEQKAPFASQLRKVEAEVGPIRYIAAMIYGDNPDAALLERAVRWVIVLLVIVFDPLAIILILAANSSLKWEKDIIPVVSTKPKDDSVETYIPPTDVIYPTVDTLLEDPKIENISNDSDDLAVKEEPEPPIKEVKQEPEVKEEVNKTMEKAKTYSNSNYMEPKYKVSFSTVWQPETKKKETIKKPSKKVQTKINSSEVKLEHLEEEPIASDLLMNNPLVETDNVTTEAFVGENEYIMYEGKQTSLSALKGLRPDLVEKFYKPEILFGTQFPAVARSGDVYTRIDVIPNKTYKFFRSKWIEVDKLKDKTYLQNIAYLQYLISKLDIGEYNPTLLNSFEEEEIRKFLEGITKLN